MIADRPTCRAMRSMTAGSSSLVAEMLTRVLGVATMEGCAGAMVGGPPVLSEPCGTIGPDDAGGSEGGAATVAPT